MNSKKFDSKSNLLSLTRRFLLAVVVEGILAALWLLLIPKEARNAVFLGYSLQRLAVLVPILGLAGLTALIRLGLKKKPAWQSWLVDEKRRAILSKITLFSGFLLALFCWSFLFFFFFMKSAVDVTIYIRLLPVIAYLLLFGVEVLLFTTLKLIILRNTSGQKFNFLFGKPFWIAFIVLVFGWLLIELTGLGKQPEIISIISLGVPLLEGQVWYIFGLLFLILWLAGGWSRLPALVRGRSKIHPDLLICITLWVLAAGLWLSLPLPKHNYFAPTSLPPNFEKYPFSDAEQYDMNSLWVWKGSIDGIVVSKPLYVIFLSVLHALVGLDYDRVIILQTLVLALLPAVLYLFGKEMHSRLGGLVMGLFAILREMNSILATNIANVSSSKLLLSDLPATLLVCVLVLVIIRWFKSGEDKIGLPPFIIGGIIGCLNLMRIQTLLLEPFVLLLLIIRYKKRFKQMLIAGGLVFLALALVLAPVLVRNHAITGVYWVDDPATSSALYRFFADASQSELDVPIAETREEMLDRNITVISQVISQDFGKVIKFMVDNFLHNLISTFLILPIRLGNPTVFLDYLQINQPFWEQVYSQPNLLNLLVILFNFVIISIGVASAHQKSGKVLWVLLAFYITYNLSSALVRLSGWRYILPVDWLVYAFFTFGLVECVRWVTSRLIGCDGFGDHDWLCIHEPTTIPVSLSWKPVLACGLIFFSIGAYIPLRENLLPVDYPTYTREEVCVTIQSALLDSQWNDRTEEIYDFCMREDVRAVKGIGIFPRYFEAGSGFYDRIEDPYFGIQDYGRLVFRTIGSPNSKVYIKTNDANIRFPNGTEVYAIGEKGNRFEACVVFIDGIQPQVIVSPTDCLE